VRNFHEQNFGDSDYSSFAPQVRNGAAIKALGIISTVLNDADTESIAAFLASEI
jgi:1-deoxy-D-xylulose 5-phosphate reductoisomerase